jgi:hypothetical protein
VGPRLLSGSPTEQKVNIVTQLQHAKPEVIITLQQPPLSVNIKTDASG